MPALSPIFKPNIHEVFWFSYPGPRRRKKQPEAVRFLSLDPTHVFKWKEELMLPLRNLNELV